MEAETPTDRMMRSVLITGGSRGIGAATARLAGARGYSVLVSYRTRRDVADTVVRCNAPLTKGPR